MKSKNNDDEKRLSPAMVEDEATEKLKKRARDLGLIVNAGKTTEAGQKEDDRRKREAKQ